MTRPELNRQISPQDFLSFYWLKEELIIFLHAQGFSTSDSKQELTSRISRFLETGRVENNVQKKLAKKAEMPMTLTCQSVIGPGWRCSQELRAFLEREIGPHFHFDGVMRDFIHNGVGKTLQEAIETWEAEQRNPRQEKPIAPQFEYNRHVREYFKAHPGAPLAEAIQDWKNKKQDRRSTKYETRKELP
jgi:hypothetical protein